MKRPLLILFLFIYWSSNLFSQNLVGNYFDFFSKKDLQVGSQNSSNDALIDSEGVLWLATNSGLVRWDGRQKRTYNQNAPEGYFVEGTLFRQIFERDSSALVIQSQGSQPTISILEKNKQRGQTIPFVSPDNKNLNGYLSYTFQSPDGEIFAAWSHQNQIEIFRLEKDKFQSFLKIDFEFSVEKKYTRASFFQNEIWVGIEEEGIWRCSKEKRKLVFDFKKKSKHPSRTLTSLHADRNGRLWLLLNTEENIYLWNETNGQFVSQKNPFAGRIDILEEDKKGNLLFISGRYPRSTVELFLLQDTSWVNYTQFIHPEILSFHRSKDFSNSLLAVTNKNIQVVEIKKKGVQHFLKMELPPSIIFGNIIKGINEDLDGNIYFSEEIDQLYKMDKDTREISIIPLLDEEGNLLKYRCGGAMHRDREGHLWFKTCDEKPEGRLVRFNPKTQHAEYYYLNQLIRDIDVGEDGKIWVTSHSFNDKKGRLSYFDKKSKKFVLVDLEGSGERSYFPEPRFIWYENDSKIWIGTLDGLIQVNPGAHSFKTFTTENSQLSNDRIIAIHQDEKGKLILGTHGGGVQIFDPTTGNNKTFTELDGLTNDFVGGIVPIDEKRYWLSTFEGVSYWDTEISLFTNFDKSHGFEELDFNRYAFYKSSDGNIFLGNVNGVNQFKTDQLIGQGQPPRIGISQVKKYYGKTDKSDVQVFDLEKINTIQLNPNVTYLELSFFAYDFKGGKTSKIFTKLEGYDDDWELVGEDGQVRYRLLPAGNYQLFVKGYSTQGVQSANQLQIEIISKPHFYNAWWFYPLILGAILGASFLLFKRRIRQIKNEEAKKQQIQKRFAMLELQALQAQLNPHFIFNALGAIQYYIQVNEVESADVYLTRFAQLMRKYLDSSKEKMISLKDEIELLQIYSELEQLRFDNIFDVQFVISDGLEIEDISLPSMMIQPFLENAVNHGLSMRNDGKGKMEIHFFGKNDSLICEVRDNGIGRENAKANKRKGHKSRGMTILDEKIQTMKMSGMMDIKIEISDWKKEKQYPGTLVVLNFFNLLD